MIEHDDNNVVHSVYDGMAALVSFDGQPPKHVCCRCVTVPMVQPIQLPGEDVLDQAERIVAEYEAEQKR